LLDRLVQRSHKLYLRLLRYFRPYGTIAFVTLLAVAMASATDVLLIRLLQNIVDALRPQALAPGGPGSGIPGMILGWLDRLLPIGPQQKALWVIPAVIVFLAVVRMLTSFVGDYGSAWLSTRVQSDMREGMFERILCLPNRFFDRSSTGTILSRVAFDTNQVSQAGLNIVNVLVRDSVATVGYMLSLFSIDWQLALLCLVLLPPIAITVALSGRRMRKLGQTAQAAMGELTSVLDESIGGQKVVKIFGGQEYERMRFNHVAKRNRQVAVKHAATAALNSGAIMLLIGVMLALVIFFALTRAHEGALSPGAFVAFIGALLAMQSPIKNLTKINEPLQRGLAAAESIFNLLDTPIESDAGSASPERTKGHIELQHVSFQYDPAADDSPSALREVSLKIEPGETVALVGSSGSGKTTLAGLLPRFYDVGAGRVLLDGIDVRDYRLLALRKQFSLVSQDVILFNDSIAANISYGDPAPLQEKIEAAARAAYAHEFVVQQPLGYRTVVGENGLRLSGGQRQRLAIARAFYKNAPILILDEATSALDTESERQVQAGLETLMQGRTTVVIAHRLSTIENADHIVVMREGQIVETGTHDTLLLNDGAYAQLYLTQKSQTNEPA
jgi:subfamily B ATP-binding cassette protein MsbA